jgi:hypothetical protein
MLTSLIAKLGIDTGSFETGLNKAKGAVKGMLGTLGVPLGAMGMLAFFKSTVSHAHDLENQAERLDMSAEALQRLQFAFSQTGVSGDKFNGIMGKFALTTEKAIEGSEDHAKALSRIGVTADQLIGLSLDERLMLIADAAKASGDETKVTATMMDLMGKKGFAMVPAMMKGSEGIRQMGLDAKVLDDQMIQSLATIDKWFNTTKGAGTSMFGESLQGLETLKKGIEGMNIMDLLKVATGDGFDVGVEALKRGQIAMQEEKNRIKLQAQAEKNAAAEAAIREKERKTTEEISKLEEERSKKLDEFTFSRMSDEEKINSLMDDRSGLEERAGQNTVEGAKARKDQLDIDVKIADLQDKVAKAKEESDKKEADRAKKMADEEDRILQGKNKAEEDAHNRAVRMASELADIEEKQRRDGLRSSQKIAEDVAAIKFNKDKMAAGVLPEEEARIKLENKTLADRADAEFKRKLKLTPEQKNQETRDRHAEEKAQRRAEAHRKSLEREAERKGPSKELESLRMAEKRKQELEQAKQAESDAIIKTRQNTADTVAKLNQIILDGLTIKGIVNT